MILRQTSILKCAFLQTIVSYKSYKERIGLSTVAGRYFLALSLGKHMGDDHHAYDTQENLCLSSYMREVPLVPTNTRKYLGVQRTSNLDWGTHVELFQPRLIGLSDYSNAISNTVLLASKRQQ